MKRLWALLVIFWVIFWASYLQAFDLPTKENPLVIDEKGKRVLLYAEVNPNNLSKESTHFGVLYRYGKLSEKALIWVYVKPEAFYDALVKIGAKPGNNLTPKSEGKLVEGSPLEVTFLLGKNLKRYPLSHVILDISGKDYDIRFGGNRAYAEKEKTGCITCLESCWVGITSNARYPYIGSLHRFLKPNSHFKLNPELKNLLKEGPIYIEYKLK